MRYALRLHSGLTLLFLSAGLLYADTNPATGLWVGEVILQRVNETVTGVGSNNQFVSPDPNVTTPVSSPAHMRIIFSVDTNSQVNLLKSVAMVRPSGTTNTVLLTDPSQYSQYGNSPGQRLTATAFDFGDGPAAQNALDNIAAIAATNAVNGANPLAATTGAVVSYQTNMPTGSTVVYSNFIESATFSGAASTAATAATVALNGVSSSVSAGQKIQIATLAAAQALKDAGVYAAADALVLNQVPMTGQIAPSGTLTGTIYLGADHPTNPFRHKWNPIERHGYAITRSLTINFDSASSTNATAQPGFGVDYITGTYRESISGLHKPLGPNQNIGLITDGVIQLKLVSPLTPSN